MTKQEEKAWQHFEELKNILPQLLPYWWKKDFKFYVNRFIEEHLDMKDLITEIPGEDEEDKDLDCIYIHGLQCLVAGAF
jgi:hypothetical protein